jgi:hypothetical protein
MESKFAHSIAVSSCFFFVLFGRRNRTNTSMGQKRMQAVLIYEPPVMLYLLKLTQNGLHTVNNAVSTV